jgi:hypothetical protein
MVVRAGQTWRSKRSDMLIVIARVESGRATIIYDSGMRQTVATSVIPMNYTLVKEGKMTHQFKAGDKVKTRLDNDIYTIEHIKGEYAWITWDTGQGDRGNIYPLSNLRPHFFEVGKQYRGTGTGQIYTVRAIVEHDGVRIAVVTYVKGGILRADTASAFGNYEEA